MPLNYSGRRNYLVFNLCTLVSFYCKAQPTSCKLTFELVHNVQNRGCDLHTGEICRLRYWITRNFCLVPAKSCTDTPHSWQDRRQRPWTENTGGSVRTSAITLLWGWLSTATGCPGRFWSLQPHRYSKAIWTRSWTAGSMWPCLSRGVEPTTSHTFCQPQPHVILWIT